MNTGKNIKWTVLEFLSVVCVQFFVMRYIISVLGVEALGIWSVLISTVQFAGFIGKGSSAGVGRFISIANANKNVRNIEEILSTLVYGTIPIYTLLCLILYLPLSSGLSFFIYHKSIGSARSLLPFALMVFFFQILSTSLVSSINGIHLGHIKSKIAIIGSLIQGGLSVYLIDEMGLIGLAIAQIANHIYLVFIIFIVIKVKIGISFISILIPNFSVLREVVQFGLKLQLTSIFWGGFEAAIRLLMSKFGGLEQVGLYEVAYRISSQSRILLFYVGQVITPVLTNHWVISKKMFYEFYNQTFIRMFIFGVMFVSMVVITSPLTGLLIIGQIKTVYVIFIILTSLSAFVQIYAIPAELSAVAIGKVRYNVMGTMVSCVSSIILGSVFGYFYNAIGVSMAVLVSSCLAASVPLVYGVKAFDLYLMPRFEAFDIKDLFKVTRSV